MYWFKPNDITKPIADHTDFYWNFDDYNDDIFTS